MIKYILILLKGIAMGAADVVPGVSGGTIAFITGIYERLLGAIASFDRDFFSLLFKLKIKDCWEKIDGTFLVILFVGIIISIITLAKLIIFLLKAYPVYIRSFFFGLILISAWIVSKKINNKKNYYLFIPLFIGIIVAYLITSSGILETPNNIFTLFLSGFIAIIAMILPGISGSYILLILNKYQYVIGIVANFADKLKEFLKTIISGNFAEIGLIVAQMQLLNIFVFVLGAILGLLMFSKLLNWLLKKFHDQIVVLLIGFMIGSLYKVRPWKVTIETYIDRHGELKALRQGVVFPHFDSEFVIAIIIMIFAILLIFGVEQLASKFSNQEIEES